MVNTEKQQVDKMTDHFKKVFEKANQQTPTYFSPCKNTAPFTSEEMQMAVKKLKNGKSSGIDEMHAELLKYAPKEVHQTMADILNSSVETEDSLSLFKVGILNPLQKPPKKGMERKIDVRPITLLPCIRKVLAICVIERTWQRLKGHIRKDQAAYQTGRSTTEQVFALKILAEKAITSQNFQIFVTMIDHGCFKTEIKNETSSNSWENLTK